VSRYVLTFSGQTLLRRGKHLYTNEYKSLPSRCKLLQLRGG